MSDAENEVPALDPESKAFLARHQQTGEPSAEALERGLRRLSAPATTGTPKLASVKPLPRARRPILPPEAMAAAAVVVLLLGGQGLYLAFRHPAVTAPIPPKGVDVNPTELGARAADPDVKAVAEAWRAGDFETARHLAARECNSDACGSLKSELAQMLGLAEHLETLSPDERAQLAAFDKKLSDGRDSALRRMLENQKRPAPPPDSAEALARAQKLFEEARESKRLKNSEAAVVQLEECVTIAPSFPPCYRLLGSVYAMIAAQNQSAGDMERARRAYQTFLEVAPEDDEYVPKVTAILAAARAPPSSDAIVQSSFNLVEGGHGTLSLNKDISRVAIGDPSVADIKTIGTRDLRIDAVKAGTTTVLLWHQDGSRMSVSVVVKEATDLDSKIGKLLDEVALARTKGHTQQAFKKLQVVLQLEPQNEEALRLRADMLRDGREAYHRGYQLRETDPGEATRLFKSVLQLLPPDDDTHQKAKSRLKELE
jgi:tetratricopeptide (TPR) repeat protein